LFEVYGDETTEKEIARIHEEGLHGGFYDEPEGYSHRYYG
jgi:hypothetical protein